MSSIGVLLLLKSVLLEDKFGQLRPPRPRVRQTTARLEQLWFLDSVAAWDTG